MIFCIVCGNLLMRYDVFDIFHTILIVWNLYVGFTVDFDLQNWAGHCAIEDIAVATAHLKLVNLKIGRKKNTENGEHRNTHIE